MFKELVVLAGVMISVSGWSELTDEDCQLRTCISGPPIEDDANGRWATGLLIGTVGASIKSGGFFYTSGEMEFLVGGGLPETLAGRYPAEVYSVSIEQSNDSLWYSLRQRESDKGVVLKYNYPFIHTGLKTATKYIVFEAEELDDSFRDSSSYENYENGITDERSYEYESTFNKDGSTAGVIVHVSRWGQKLYERRCTVYLHQGGMKTVTRDQYYTEIVTYTDANGQTQTRREYRNRPVTEVVPHVYKMNTFNEHVCLYAEQAARSQTRVKIGYSGGETSTIHDITGIIIHSIQALGVN